MDGRTPEDDTPFLKVLASGSGGNCTVLLPGGRRGRFWLIDAGLSPRRTRRLLRDADLSLDQLDGVLLTHLDWDHWHPSWRTRLPTGVRLLAHSGHARRGRLIGLLPESVESFTEDFAMGPDSRVLVHLVAHDDLGAAAFRFELPGGTLGFATDVGRVERGLITHLKGVDVLAIESNYCPRLQIESRRPWFLKRRIMGGHGHLSNQQSAAAVRAIGPRRHLVLLHLSRECNEPALVSELHRDALYEVTVTSQHWPTRWIPIAGVGERLTRRVPVIDAPLFMGLPEPAQP
jgi:phosphoribosyl 1,2-cyclic phosphodiesterase